MPVFASQFGRARPYAVAYAGPASESRFWTPATVTTASIGAAVVLAAAVGDALADVDLPAASLAFDPDALDHAALELPGLATGNHLVVADTGADTGADSGAHSGAHAGAATGTHGTHMDVTGAQAGGTAGGADDTAASLDTTGATDLTARQAELLDRESASEWAHHSDPTHTTVGGDGSFSYPGTDDSAADQV
jgi:hypothetical protein